MDETIVGLFDYNQNAQATVNDLVAKGIRREDISLLANAATSESANAEPVAGYKAGIRTEVETLTAGEGAGFGAVVGAVTGIVIGLASLAIPGVGLIIGAGPLIAGLTGGTLGAVAGAATGGIAAALIQGGVPEEDAPVYAEGIRRGGTLVTVRADPALGQEIRDIMKAHHAADISERRTEWLTDQGADALVATAQDNLDNSTLQTPAPVNTVRDIPDAAAKTKPRNDLPWASRVAFTTLEPEFRSHFSATHAEPQYAYEQFAPSYRLGYDLATDPRYATDNWDEVEPDARRFWEERNSNNSWDNFKDAVRYAWQRVRSYR